VNLLTCLLCLYLILHLLLSILHRTVHPVPIHATPTDEPHPQASSVEEAHQDARYELEDCEAEVEKLLGILEKSGRNSSLYMDIGAFAEILREKVDNFQYGKRAKAKHSYRSYQLERLEDNVLASKSHIIKLHSRLMTAQLKARAAERRWNLLLSEHQRQEVKCLL
jgi:hypothetical protein